MKVTALLTAFIILVQVHARSQEDIFTLSGNVADSMSNEKLVNASLLLKGETDTLLRWSTICDSQGGFILKDIIPGNYILTVSHTGYLASTQKVQVYKNEKIFFKLLKANTALASITIFSEKKLVTHTSDKITYNVSESAVTSSDNLYNIILNVPGVVESNGTLFYQGKPLLILLDNKSNNLTGEDLKNYLSGMLGANVDKLEVLLNPSSKYDAQGGAAFNIRSVKNKNYGLTKSITLGAGSGTYFRNTAGFALNYRNTKINIFGGYDFNYQKQFFRLNSFYEFTTAATIDLLEHNIRTHNNHSIRLGIDYDIDKRTSLGFLFKGFQNYRHRNIKNTSVYTPAPGVPDTLAIANTFTNAVFKSPSLNIYFRRQLNKSGTELVFNGDYFDYTKKWDEDMITAFSDHIGNTISPSKYLLNKSPAHNYIKSVTADLYQSLKNGKFEAGFKLGSSRTDNNVLWQELFSNTWKTDSGKTNHFIYKENVYASYINASKNYGKFTIQAGLRFEATRANGISITINKITESNYNNLFPSVSVQYKPVKTQQFLVNYRKSIRRFGFDIINPFVLIRGPYLFHQGNPYIKPSFFNSIDVSWSYKNKLIISSGFSAVKYPMSYAFRKDGSTNATIGTFLNFSSGKLYNSSINYTEKFFKSKWTSINSVNFLHTQLPGFDSEIQYSNSYVLNTVNAISLPAKFTMELSAFYRSPFLDGTVWQNAEYAVSMGFSKLVLKSKGSLKLSCTDLFNTQISNGRTDGAGVRINAYWKPESRFVNLLFTYRFGNLNVKANKNRNTGIEEEKSRMAQ